jgi:hypothetical protein
MNKYFIMAILLKDCGYSNAAHKLLQSHNIPITTTWVDDSNKNIYKTDQIDTFPQIYLKKYNSKGTLLLGGYNDLSNVISTFYKQKLSDDNINNWSNKSKWSKKSTLRLIQLINNIN